jgi:hypothetical protein
LLILLFLESFAATGWRVGWLLGPESLIKPTLAASTRIVFCSVSPLQEAAAAGLEGAAERRFFETQLQEYTERRDILVEAFNELGLKYTMPEGSYFILLVGVVLHRTIPFTDSSPGYLKSQDPRRLPIPRVSTWTWPRLQVRVMSGHLRLFIHKVQSMLVHCTRSRCVVHSCQ